MVTLVKSICIYCKNEFESPKRLNRKFCSSECYHNSTIGNTGTKWSSEKRERIMKIFHSKEYTDRRVSTRRKNGWWRDPKKISEIMSMTTKGTHGANETSFKKGHNHGINMEKCHNWKGGSKETFHKYARSVMKKHIGRKLTSEEEVHHLDFDYKNNNIENLYLFKTSGEHTKYHWFLRKIVKEVL